MQFRLLGPLSVSVDGEPLALTGQKPRALLAALLLEANRVVSRDRLIDAVWGEEPPDTARNTLQVYVSQLRKLLPDGVLETASHGYKLVVDREAVDLFEFVRLSEEGRNAVTAGDAAGAGETLRRALQLWDGATPADLPEAEMARLEELRAAALEDRIDAELALGRHGQVVPELERLGNEHPLRERFRGQLMLALYRCGRQADALAVYQRTRRTLVDELGIEPSASLRKLEQAILAQDASLSAPQAQPASARRIPAPATPLLGRERELAALAELARAGGTRLVTLTGTGGIGKTRLALELARRLAPEFQQGAAVATLATLRDPALVAHAILEALDVPEAAELFIARAQAANPDFALSEQNAAAVAELCARLDGLPLAIELAAARTKLLPPATLLSRLSNRLELLTGGRRAAPRHQQTLRTTLDWSYDLLEPEVQRLFARLGVFAGGCTLASAEAVCDGDVSVLEGLAALVDESLVRQRETADGEPRFSMLEIVREYAFERLGSSGERDEL